MSRDYGGYVVMHRFMVSDCTLPSRICYRHGGSGVGSYKTMLQKYYPSARYLESLDISGASVRDAASKTSVESWVKNLGLFGHSER